MELRESVIAITGAGQGLGQMMAITLAHCGAELALMDVNEQALKETQDQCHMLGVKALTYCVDVTSEVQVEQVFGDIVTDFGRLDGLINNAGILRDGLLVKVKDGQVSKMSLEQFNSVINVNLTGTFLCGREAALRMIETNCHGVIINISSIAATETYPWVGYKVAKAGILALTEQLAIQNAEYGIRCVSLAPGKIDTVMAVDARAKAWGKSREEIAAERAASVPIGRQGTAWDVANAALFMASDEASFISGVHLRIDGAAGCRVG